MTKSTTATFYVSCVQLEIYSQLPSVLQASIEPAYIFLTNITFAIEAAMQTETGAGTSASTSQALHALSGLL